MILEKLIALLKSKVKYKKSYFIKYKKEGYNNIALELYEYIETSIMTKMSLLVTAPIEQENITEKYLNFLNRHKGEDNK